VTTTTTGQAEQMDGAAASRAALLRRGLGLEYATLGWNVVGVVVLANRERAALRIIAVTVLAMFGLAAGKRHAGRRLGSPVLQTESRVTAIDGALAAAVLTGLALNAALGWWWADPLSALVILVFGLREARHAWAEAG
jgi:divalent metal cation (Fe/Co/Zn/Cd) transporter